MKDLPTKLEQARTSFLQHSGTSPEASCMLILAWNQGAATMMKLMSDMVREERINLERLHNYERRIHD